MTKEAEAAEEGREETKERAEVKHFVSARSFAYFLFWPFFSGSEVRR